MFLNPDKDADVLEITNGLKSNRCHIKFIRNLHVGLLVLLINKVFRNGEFPDNLKRAIFKPLHKKGENDKIIGISREEIK